MSKILNEVKTAEAMKKLAEKFNSVVDKAKAAINEHQPLGVSPKIGKAAGVIGSSAALGVEKAVVAKKSVSFFFKTVIKSYADTRAAFNEANKTYETMRDNLKAKQAAPAVEEVPAEEAEIVE